MMRRAGLSSYIAKEVISCDVSPVAMFLCAVHSWYQMGWTSGNMQMLSVSLQVWGLAVKSDNENKTFPKGNNGKMQIHYVCSQVVQGHHISLAWSVDMTVAPREGIVGALIAIPATVVTKGLFKKSIFQ